MERNFRTHPNGVTDTLNLPYDTKSIMHYGNKAFSKNGRKTIISRQKPWERLGGHHKKLSKIDNRQLNKLYNCKPDKRKHLHYGKSLNSFQDFPRRFFTHEESLTSFCSFADVSKS